jgi:hypothetical protein
MQPRSNRKECEYRCRDDRKFAHLNLQPPAPAADIALPVYPEGAGNINNGIAGVEPLDRLAALMRRQLERSAEPDAAHFGSLAAFAGPSPDECPLEFGEASEDRQHQHPMGGSGIAPSILERAEARAGLLHRFQDIQRVAGGAGQPVEPLTTSTSRAGAA